MKIIFAGSPEYAVPSLQALVQAGKQVVAVVTQPDKPVGRKKILTPTPVKAYALAAGLPVLDSAKISDNAEELSSFGADAMITCAYGQILKNNILSLFPSGIWNLHASLLPEFRGASPIQSAILAGKTHTGVTVMKTEPELDAGGILLVKRCAVGDKTCGELSRELSLLSAQAAVEAVGLLESGEAQVMMQDEAKATYCKKISKQDAKIDFNRPAEEVVRLINAMSPSPAAYCALAGNVFNIYKAALCTEEYAGQAGDVVASDKRSGVVVACASGAVRILSAQPSGGKILSAADLVNGRKIKAGDRFD